MKYLIILSILCSAFFVNAQKADTPLEDYQWKNGKTVAAKGYVVIKSGKKLDGMISLKGSPTGVSEINYEGQGKEISFPPAALLSFGLYEVESQTEAKTTGNTVGNSGPVNDSPEGMYEWKFMGTVMNKEIHTSVPRDGYVILKNGTKQSGMLKLKKKDGVLTNYEIKPATGKKIKGETSNVSNYGYNVSEGVLKQQQLASGAGDFYSGTVDIGDEILEGLVFIKRTDGKFYSKSIIFKSSDGKLSEYNPETALTFSQTIGGVEKKYIAVEGTYVREEFNGHVFRLYRNPFPTTYNRFASDLAKAGIQAGTTAAAESIVNKDAKKNNYTTNMDSIIRVSTKEELIKMRDAWVTAAGYGSADQLLENSNNESLKNNISALELAIAGREAAQSEGGILNKEWVILNKDSGEKTIVYKGDYKSLMEPLLKGCFEYLTMDKSEQKKFRSWSELIPTVRFLDACY